jgi:hypothetical protein
VVLPLRGRLSLRSTTRIRESIVKSLANNGRVLIDLSPLHCSQASFLTVFPAALAAAGGWPSARLVLFGADADLQSALASVNPRDGSACHGSDLGLCVAAPAAAGGAAAP